AGTLDAALDQRLGAALTAAQSPLDARAKDKGLAGQLRSLASAATALPDPRRAAALADVLKAMAGRLD
ncbi:MAG: hypothetical protein ABIR51_01420, partial [Sphingomicrobium sp.]